MAVMPGAIYKPITTKARGKRRKGRGICLHVAVSEAASLFGYFSRADADSHFYVRRDGTIEQYVDTDLVAYANLSGNSTLISVETQGGVTNVDGEPWTPQQVAALARICAWAAAIDGFPLQAMPDSRPSSRGVGYHRQGCAPHIVADGEKWSSSYGKACPGAAKIRQIPAVIAAAKSGSSVLEDDLPTPRELWEHPIATDEGTFSAEVLLRRSFERTGGIPRAVIDGLLDAPIDRSDLGRGETTWRQILRWSDPNTDRLLNAIDAATSAALDPQAVAERTREAVKSEIESLRLTVHSEPSE